MKSLALVAALAVGAAAPASAAFFDIPVPDNAYITIGGLDWAWANPCGPFDSCGDIDLSYQSTQGWRLPTVADFALRPDATDFLFAGANVPDGGDDPATGATFFGSNPGDAACATPYFSSIYRHCDWSDGVAGFIWDPGLPGGQGVPETWVVRDTFVGPPIPEPATWALMIAGFGLVGASLRRRSAATA